MRVAGQVRVWSRRLSLALQPATTQPILFTWTYRRVCVGFRIPGVRVCVHRRGGLLPLEAALLSFRTGLRTHRLPLVPSFWPAPALTMQAQRPLTTAHYSLATEPGSGTLLWTGARRLVAEVSSARGPISPL